MQTCKWHWACCEALLGNTTPLGRLLGRPQLYINMFEECTMAPRLAHACPLYDVTLI